MTARVKFVQLEVTKDNLVALLKKPQGWPHSAIKPDGMTKAQVIKAEYRTTDRRRLFIVNHETGQSCLISGYTFRQAFARLQWDPKGCHWLDRPGAANRMEFRPYGANWPEGAIQTLVLGTGKDE